MTARRRDALRGALFVLACVVVWQVLALAGLSDPLFFPSPWEVLRSLWESIATGRLPAAVWISLRRLALGYGAAAVSGVLLGLLLGRSAWLRSTLGAPLLGLQALPSICWLPLALLWFGLSEKAIFFVVFMGSVVSISTATQAGVLNVPPLYVRAARSMGAYGLGLYRTVILPAALPQVITGAKLGWSFAWRSLMAAELLYVSGGLGQMLAMGRELHDMALVLAVMVVIVAIGLTVERAFFDRVEGRMRVRWGLAQAR